VTVRGSDALAKLDGLRREWATTGLYPILLGDQENLDYIEEGYELAGDDERDTPAIVARSRDVDAPRWLADRVAAAPEYYVLDHGDWPTIAEPEMGIVAHRTHHGHVKPSVFIGLLMLDAPWEAFAWLLWGGWNACPFPVEHCAVHRYWQERYGAEVVSITHDIVQCVVSRPPTDRRAALMLAEEQYYYCADIVQQGTNTIEALAASLLNSHYWYFLCD